MLKQEAKIYSSTLNYKYFPSTLSIKNPKYLSISLYSVLAYGIVTLFPTVCLWSQIYETSWIRLKYSIYLVDYSVGMLL